MRKTRLESGDNFIGTLDEAEGAESLRQIERFQRAALRVIAEQPPFLNIGPPGALSHRIPKDTLAQRIAD